LLGQEEAACAWPAYVATSVLFTGTNAEKIANKLGSLESYRLVIVQVILSYYVESANQSEQTWCYR